MIPQLSTISTNGTSAQATTDLTPAPRSKKARRSKPNPILLVQGDPIPLIPELAVKLGGVHEAIFMQQLHYWLMTSPHMREGQRWIYNTYEGWLQQLPFLTLITLRRLVEGLREQNLIITTSKFNKRGGDKTLWYTINDVEFAKLFNVPPQQHASAQNEQTEGTERVLKMSSPNAQNEQTPMLKMSSPCAQNEQTITRDYNRDYPETTTETIQPTTRARSEELPPTKPMDGWVDDDPYADFDFGSVAEAEEPKPTTLSEKKTENNPEGAHHPNTSAAPPLPKSQQLAVDQLTDGEVGMDKAEAVKLAQRYSLEQIEGVIYAVLGSSGINNPPGLIAHKLAAGKFCQLTDAHRASALYRRHHPDYIQRRSYQPDPAPTSTSLDALNPVVSQKPASATIEVPPLPTPDPEPEPIQLSEADALLSDRLSEICQANLRGLKSELKGSKLHKVGMAGDKEIWEVLVANSRDVKHVQHGQSALEKVLQVALGSPLRVEVAAAQGVAH